MSRLQDIPRKDFFRVPEGYFEKLPAKIQARVETSKTHETLHPWMRYALTYALPLVIAAIVIFYSTRSQPDVEAMLASVETADLIYYIQESEITTEEMLETVDFTVDELEALENEAYDLNLEGTDAETLHSEFNSVLP